MVPAPASQLKTVIFDMDGVLYPIENGYEKHIRQRIFQYMSERFNLTVEEAKATWAKYYKITNQTLKALRMAGFEFDVDEYWDYIRCDQDDFLVDNPPVRELLKSIAADKEVWVLTNCNEKWAHLALKRLGIDGLFKGVLGSDFMSPNCKPDKEAFLQFFDRTSTQPETTVMFEDSTKNLRSAKSLGMTTILVVGETAIEDGFDEDQVKEFVDAVIDAPTVESVTKVLPGLLQQ